MGNEMDFEMLLLARFPWKFTIISIEFTDAYKLTLLTQPLEIVIFLNEKFQYRLSCVVRKSG